MPLAPPTWPAHLGFTTSGVTTVLDRLGRDGYIRRAPSGDRRRLMVEVTAAITARNRKFGDILRQTRDLLATYTHDRLA